MSVDHTNSTNTTTSALINTTTHLYVFLPQLDHHQEIFHYQQLRKSRFNEICVAMLLIYVNRLSQWQHGLRSGSAVIRLLGLRVRIPPRSFMPVF